MIQSRKRSNIVPITKDPRATNALKYRPEFCQSVTDLARQGHFPEEWCAQIAISLSTMYNWANRYPAFDEACQLVWTNLTAYWTRQVVHAARGEPANARVFIHVLQKRFPDTVGHTARNTHANFPTDASINNQQPNEPAACTYENMTIAELNVELHKLKPAR